MQNSLKNTTTCSVKMPVKWEKFKLKRLGYYLNHVGYKVDKIDWNKWLQEVLSEPCGI